LTIDRLLRIVRSRRLLLGKNRWTPLKWRTLACTIKRHIVTHHWRCLL